MTLIEKAQENIEIDPEQAGDLARRMKNADFTLVPANLIGLPVTARTESAAPPRRCV